MRKLFLIGMSCAALEVSAESVFRIDFDGADGEPTLTQNVTYVDGIDGRAVHVPTNGALAFAYKEGLGATRGTISVWYRLDWTPWGGKTFRDKTKDDDGNWYDDVRMLGNGTQARTLLNIPGAMSIEAGSLFSAEGRPAFGCATWNRHVYAGEWHHVVVSWDVEKSFDMYFDGSLVNSQWIRNKTPIDYAGRTIHLGFGRPFALGGAIDRVRFWSRKLGDDEVLAEFAALRPRRLELLDWSVSVGETKAVRFRERDLKTGSLREFTQNITAPATQGCFRVTMKRGTAEEQTFELYALGEMKNEELGMKNEGGGNPGSSDRLVAEYDCTKEWPTNLMIDCGSHVVTNGNLIYREADRNKTGEGMLYRFRVERTGVPYRLVAEYPDDAQREYSFAVYPYSFNRFYMLSLDCFGVHSGWDHPITGTMQTKELIFWPDSKDFAVGILGYRTLKESRSPAVARLRLYETSLPAAANVGAAGGRTVGIWEEDPTMDAGLAFNQCVNWKVCDLDFWRIKWERVIAYMRHMGVNTWVFKAMAYSGDATAMWATLDRIADTTCNEGRVPGWAELGTAMLDRAGMDVWARLNNKLHALDWMPRLLGVDIADLEFCGADGRPSTSWQAPFNVFHPAVFAYFKRTLAAYRDKFKVYPHFRGVMLNEAPGFHFGSIRYGYDDTTVGMFERETGVKVPGKTCAARYAYLAEGAGYGKWVEWRCRKVTESVRELVSTLRAGGGERLRLQFVINCDFTADASDRWPDYDLPKLHREAGIDLAALKAIDGLDVIPTFHPGMTQSSRMWPDEEYIPYDPRTAEAYGHDMPNFFIERHSNLEIYPDMSLDQGATAWKSPFWWPYGCNVQGKVDFQNYATPHPDNAFALSAMANVVADYDVQDLLHGFWGIPESGAHSEFRRFYDQFRSIPRGKYALLGGWSNDPVAIRVGEKSHYLVNRLWAPVTVSYCVDGRRRTLTLAGNELRHVAEVGAVTDVSCTVDADYLKTFSATVAKMRTILKANPGRADFSDLMSKIERAIAEGRYFQAQALTTTRIGREARNTREIASNPWFDWKTGELVFRARNFGLKPFKGGVKATLPAHDWKPLKTFVPLKIPVNGVGECRIPYDCLKDPAGSVPRDHLFRLTLVEGTDEQDMQFQFPGVFAKRDGLEAVGWSGFLRQRWHGDKKASERLGTNDNVTVYAYLFDPKGEYLKFHAEVTEQDFFPPTDASAMYTRDSLQLYFDQRNNARFDTGTGYDEDDVVFQVGLVNGAKPTVFQEYPQRKALDIPVSIVRRTDGKTVYDVTFPKTVLPFADLKPRHGNVIGAGLLVNDLCEDAGGRFAGSYQMGQQYQTPRNWRDLYISYDRPGCVAEAMLGARAAVKSSPLVDAPQVVGDAFVPQSDGTVAFRVSPAWGSIVTVADVAVKGADIVGGKPKLPMTLAWPKAVELQLKVKAGAAVKAGAKVKMAIGE